MKTPGTTNIKPPPRRTQSRREFIGTLAASGTALALSPSSSLQGAPTAPPRRPVIVFSKAFQELNYDATAELVAEIGWDGIECPVRKGGQVLPERIEDDLPKMVEALKKRGKAMHIATTDVRDASDPATQKVLRALAKSGIKRYRTSYWKYDLNKPIPPQLNEIKAQLKDLVALNRELGLVAGIQNHSGVGYVGAPIWDIHELIHELDPAHLGIFFDIGHATVEGGYAWQIHSALMQPLYQSIYVKDFTWAKTDQGWRAQWCPLGQGMVNRAFFQKLNRSAFAGPISQHIEFRIGQDQDMRKVFKGELQTLKGWLAA